MLIKNDERVWQYLLAEKVTLKTKSTDNQKGYLDVEQTRESYKFNRNLVPSPSENQATIDPIVILKDIVDF